MAKKDKADKAPKASKPEKAAKGDTGGKLDRSEKKKGAKKKDLAGSGLLSASVTQVARAMRTRLSHGLSQSGLYPGQDGVIQLLAADDGMTPGALALRLGVKAPTMTRTIGRMEAQGFVTRHADDRDQRQTKVYLTGEGRNSLARIQAAMADCEREAIRGLSGKEVRQLVKLLTAIEDNLSNRPQAVREPVDLDEDD